MTHPIPRRDFIQSTAALGAGVGLLGATAASSAREKSASDKIVCGVVGLGRGMDIANAITQIKEAELRYVCDVDDRRLPAAMARLKRADAEPQVAKDFRRILDDPKVDVIVIATPDHWHAPASILACAAGKHVLVEKPCSHNPAEGEMLVAAARKHKRFVQHGTQRRTWPGIREAMDRLRAGDVGTVRHAKAWYTSQRGTMKKGQEAPVPQGLDWSLWQGPAPERPFKDNIVHYNWHWLWNWGTGEMGNNGVHCVDLARWGLGVDYPTRVTSGGGRYYFDDDQETPDTQVAGFDFGDKFISLEIKSCHPRGPEGSSFGAAFYGDKGTLVCGSNDYRIYDLKNKEVDKNKATGQGDIDHLQNLFATIRGNGKLNAEIEEGHKSTLLCHLGNIAVRAGRTLNLDPKTHRVTGDKEAEALWGREYRKGWEPKV